MRFYRVVSQILADKRIICQMVKHLTLLTIMVPVLIHLAGHQQVKGAQFQLVVVNKLINTTTIFQNIWRINCYEINKKSWSIQKYASRFFVFLSCLWYAEYQPNSWFLVELQLYEHIFNQFLKLAQAMWVKYWN